MIICHRCHLFLRLRCHVFRKGQEYQCFASFDRNDFACVDQHFLVPDVFELVLDLEVFNRLIAGNDFFKQFSQSFEMLKPNSFAVFTISSSSYAWAFLNLQAQTFPTFPTFVVFLQVGFSPVGVSGFERLGNLACSLSCSLFVFSCF